MVEAVGVMVLVTTKGVKLMIEVGSVLDKVIVGVAVTFPGSGARLNAINPIQ